MELIAGKRAKPCSPSVLRSEMSPVRLPHKKQGETEREGARARQKREGRVENAIYSWRIHFWRWQQKKRTGSLMYIYKQKKCGGHTQK